MRRWAILSIGLLWGGCAETTVEEANGPESGASVCEQVAQAVAECTGSAPEMAPGTCDGEAAEAAQQVLAQLESGGCDGASSGKEDSLGCHLLLWDPLGWCEEPLEPLGPEPDGEATQFPIVLAHGFNTSTTNFWAFNDVDTTLIADGHDVILGSVPPFDTPQVRAEFLAEQVDELLEESGQSKVNLVCFSMGGIDCRFLVSEDGMGYGDRVASLTTISSPHRGTGMADAAMGVLPDVDRAEAIDFVATLYGKTFSDVADDSHLVAALDAMSTPTMERFNEEIADHPDVFYQSWAGVSSVAGLPHPDSDAEPEACTNEDGEVLMLRHEGTHDKMDALLVGGAAFVAHGLQLRPNDGVSTVQSSKWGLFRGCIPADHLDQVGQVNDGGPDDRTGFDYLRFYRNLAYDLAARGF